MDEVKTGFGGKIGNKGAVCVSFLLYNTTVCFVTSHLCAGQAATKCEQRNANVTEIQKRLQFNFFKSFFDNDIIFWSGDLNYRVDLSYATARPFAEKNSYQILLIKDQLTVQIYNRMVGFFCVKLSFFWVNFSFKWILV